MAYTAESKKIKNIKTIKSRLINLSFNADYRIASKALQVLNSNIDLLDIHKNEIENVIFLE